MFLYTARVFFFYEYFSNFVQISFQNLSFLMYTQENINKIVFFMINDYVVLGIISWADEGLTMMNNNNN